MHGRGCDVLEAAATDAVQPAVCALSYGRRNDDYDDERRLKGWRDDERGDVQEGERKRGRRASETRPRFHRDGINPQVYWTTPPTLASERARKRRRSRRHDDAVKCWTAVSVAVCQLSRCAVERRAVAEHSWKIRPDLTPSTFAEQPAGSHRAARFAYLQCGTRRKHGVTYIQ